jgi:hypothetical protein
MAKTLTKPFMAGDWLIREDDSPAYSRGSWVYDNTAGLGLVANGGDLILPAGYPMVLGVPALAAQVITGTAITGAVFEPTVIPKGEKKAICVIERGFNVINGDALPLGPAVAADPNTTAYSLTNLINAYANGPTKWLVRREPTHQNEQAT